MLVTIMKTEALRRHLKHVICVAMTASLLPFQYFYGWIFPALTEVNTPFVIWTHLSYCLLKDMSPKILLSPLNLSCISLFHYLYKTIQLLLHLSILFLPFSSSSFSLSCTYMCKYHYIPEKYSIQRSLQLKRAPTFLFYIVAVGILKFYHFEHMPTGFWNGKRHKMCFQSKSMCLGLWESEQIKLT